MTQHCFKGTFQDFETYLKQRATPDTQIKAVFEVDKQDETLLSDEQLPESHVLHPSNRELLLKRLSKSDEQIRQGKVTKATPEFFEDIKKRGRERRRLKTQG